MTETSNLNATAAAPAAETTTSSTPSGQNDQEVAVYSITSRKGLDGKLWWFGPRKLDKVNAEGKALAAGEQPVLLPDGSIKTGFVDIGNIDPRRNQNLLRGLLLSMACQLQDAGARTVIYTSRTLKPDGRVFTTYTIRAFRNDGTSFNEKQSNAIVAGVATAPVTSGEATPPASATIPV